ncbi:VOC family protein [bacterium]|nr:VOC family protein [bacterium]
MTLLHIMIRVKDIQKSLDFYTRLFDMEIESKRRLEDCWLYFLTDKETGIQIELTYNDETPKDGYNIGNGFGHFAFSIKSMDEFTKRLHSNGYEYSDEPFDLNGKGSLIAFIKDPDGYEIELIEKVVW